MRCVFLVLLILGLAPSAWAETPEAVDTIDLSKATVLASPGAPEGLASKPLTWPLPEGPVVVLGLPNTDPAAADLALFWDLLAPSEDLHGGYLVAAWHDGQRPLVVVLADDPVALRAAHEDLPVGAMPRGVRHVRPVFRRRAYYPLKSRIDAASVGAAIAGRANRFWIEARHDLGHFDPLSGLARHGIASCLVLDVAAGREANSVERAKPWIRRGVRHVVLSPAGFDIQAEDVRRHVERLRSAFELDEIVVFHPTIRIPGTAGTWMAESPSEAARLADRSQRALASSRVPLHYMEPWARASMTPVPSRPRGLSTPLGQIFEGIVVLDGNGGREVLASAWAPRDEGQEPWETVLRPLLPRHALPPRVFLGQVVRRLDEMDEERRSAIDWLDPLRDRIRWSIEDLGERAVLVPRAPSPVHVDGRVDEAAWAYATAFALPLPDDPAGRSGVLLAVSDGRVLHVALRLAADVGPLPLVLGTSASRPDHGAPIGDGADTGKVRQAGETRTWEGTLGHYELRGDAHPTRVFHLWHVPEEGEPQRIASLVLGP